ncbi:MULTISPECIES: biopolymer transporter ExbD [Porphyromonas]|uniref:Biopolymer transporter ExbD n=1 Tax=Porphyromonas canoris TaxID=36875 RepID=A0ABR4XKI5_9PORP|nr:MULTISPECIES: biopolymer transporter ExbD [Porphyromonas]KGL52323.1 biopolymer transporter ExbD [Porphyromonas canoris]KGN70470.1 biopolymer transporter ExbD [Porphyromonas sp. COT-108 OH1349]KGN91986.1 biopolymer transporter ExbD [Porphyromonas canoris]KGN96432.1 biopolymer transporter ExbD [Porphyromonas sp. COT-108 OH2963]
MKLKRKAKVVEIFSMASMTDVIFLLLIFFMVTSTLVMPNALKVLLPQSNQQTAVKTPTRITIDKELRYYVTMKNGEDREVGYDELKAYIDGELSEDPDFFVALYADESIPYGEVVKILNIAVEKKFKMVMATRPL